jgi:triphosphatase
MTSPREIEIKLDMEPATGARLRRRTLPALGGAGETQHLVSVYFDTPACHLRKQDLTLRVRTDGMRSVQTVKHGMGPTVGFFDRAEWEVDVAGDRPNLEAAADTPVGKVLRKHPDAALAPVFTTVVDRTTWHVTQGASEIEIALDEGYVESGQARRPFAEMELELKSGAARDLFALIRKLDRANALKLGVLTKSERGYGLADAEEPVSFKAGRVDLRPDMSVGEAFRAIAYACIRHFRLNETPLLATRSVESLHQARVAMRRLRSAFTLFGPLLKGNEAQSLKRRLRDVAGELGVARNLDVYLARAIVPALEHAPSEPGLAEYRSRVEADRDRAYDHVLATLDSKRFRKLMLDLVTWLEAGPSRERVDPKADAAREQPVEAFAVDVLERHRRKVKKKGRHLASLTPAERHEVRIEAKKLRYASEFFAGLVQGRKARGRHKDFVAAIEDLQTSLGDLNDIETGHELAAAMAAPVAAPLDNPDEPVLVIAFAAGHVAGEQDERAAALLKDAAAAHRALVKAKRFWSRPER